MAGSEVNPDVELRIQPLGLKAHSMFELKIKTRSIERAFNPNGWNFLYPQG